MTDISMGLIFMKLSFTAGSLTMILVGSLIGGSISSVFYNSLYNYVNVLSRIDNRELRYFGILQGITQACNIYGRVLSAFLIEPWASSTCPDNGHLEISVQSIFSGRA